jgi:DNA-directed RNA polymerase specialized sigma24 family protein
VIKTTMGAQSLEQQYDEARREHAFMLRCEGHLLRDIAARLGISNSRVRVLLDRFSVRMNKAFRKTKLKWQH